MRRSAAPSQVAKRPCFIPPLKRTSQHDREWIESSTAVAENVIKSSAAAQQQSIELAAPSALAKPRTAQDILALFNEVKEDTSLYDNTVSLTNNCLLSQVASIIEASTSGFSTSVLQEDFMQNATSIDSSSKFSSAEGGINFETSEKIKNNLVQSDCGNMKICTTPLSEISHNICVQSNAISLISQHDLPLDANVRYFSVVWCKRSTRKHKKWEGDAVLIVKARSVLLKDTEGKVIGQSSGYKLADLASLEEGNTLPVGGKEVEIQSSISPADYTSGRCFVSAGAITASPACPDSAATPSCPATPLVPRFKPKPFKLPTRGGAAAVSRTGVRNGQPLYDIEHPDALVFPRPTPQQQFAAGGGVVDVVLDPLLGSKLRPHQRQGILFIYRCLMAIQTVPGAEGVSGCILADEMGLGKTLQCIAIVWTLLKQSPWRDAAGGGVRRVLIVVPSSLVANWGKEFQKWLGRERLPVFMADQNNKAEHFLRQQVCRVLVISYDMFLRSHAALAAPSAGFDLLICDEAHRLKNSASKTTALLGAVPARRRLLLTGTPLQNDLQEMYSLAQFAVPGALGGSAAVFRRVYEDPIVLARQAGAGEEDVALGAGRVAELNRITSLFILRRTQEIISRYLPPKVECVVFCTPTPPQADIYHAMSRLLCRAVLHSGEEHLAAVMLLRKLCNHPALLGKGECSAEEVQECGTMPLATEASLLLPPHLQQGVQCSEEDSGKLAVLSCLLWSLHCRNTDPSSEGGGERVVVVSNFTSTLDLLQGMCGRYGYGCARLDGSTPQHRRQAIVDAFNSPHSQDFVFLLSSRAGGVGLSLVGASRVVLYDIDWNPATDLQAMARLWRDGQTRTVRVYRLLLCGSVEERMFLRQVQKQALSGAVVDARQAQRGAKVAFSQQELKDLLGSDSLGRCVTHDLLQCECGLQGAPVTSLAPGTPSRACQLSASCSRDGTGTNCTMDQLFEWQHCGAACVAAGVLQDPSLESASDFISVVFRSEC